MRAKHLIWNYGLTTGAILCLIGASVILFARPLRMALPELFGVRCVDSICVEREADRQAVTTLYEAALAKTFETGRLRQRPRFIFCSTNACYARFGGGRERAISYPFLGTIVSRHSRQTYIVRHEMVHWLQFQAFGAIGTMQKPVWFREGMAYALSGAPEWDIPEHHREWVRRYTAWQVGVGEDIWRSGKTVGRDDL